MHIRIFSDLIVNLLLGLLLCGSLAVRTAETTPVDETKGSRQNIEASKEGQQGIGADIAEIKKPLQSLPRVGQIDTVQAGQHDRDPQPFALFIK